MAKRRACRRSSIQTKAARSGRWKKRRSSATVKRCASSSATPSGSRSGRPFYTIDLPPFKQGTFEIDLSSPLGLLSDPAGLTSGEGGGRFLFAASAWRTASKSVPTLPEPHTVSLRGSVTNGATHQPLAGVRVELLLGELGEEVYPINGTTDASGRFEIMGVADEQLIAADRVSLRARRTALPSRRPSSITTGRWPRHKRC